MAVKLTIPTHKMAIQLHLVAESCTNCSSRSRRHYGDRGPDISLCFLPCQHPY